MNHTFFFIFPGAILVFVVDANLRSLRIRYSPRINTCIALLILYLQQRSETLDHIVLRLRSIAFLFL